jgi:hypothetical protein
MRVLVTADSARARDVLKSLLLDRGYDVVDPAELGAGALLARSEWEADAMIAGLLAPRPSPLQRSAVLVEVGIALGRGVPLLLLTLGGKPRIPALTQVPQVEANLSDSETLALKIDLFFQGVSSGAPREPSTSASRPTKTQPAAQQSTTALERAVSALLYNNGASLVATREDASDRRPDLAFFVEGAESVGLVLVEVKHFHGEQWRRRLRETVEQLGQQVNLASAGLGLIVYDGVDHPGQLQTGRSLVAAISLAQLTDQLDRQALPDFVRRVRNAAIHGL